MLLTALFYRKGVDGVTDIFLIVKHTFCLGINKQGNPKSEFLSYPRPAFKFPTDSQKKWGNDDK